MSQIEVDEIWGIMKTCQHIVQEVIRNSCDDADEPQLLSERILQTYYPTQTQANRSSQTYLELCSWDEEPRQQQILQEYHYEYHNNNSDPQSSNVTTIGSTHEIFNRCMDAWVNALSSTYNYENNVHIHNARAKFDDLSNGDPFLAAYLYCFKFIDKLQVDKWLNATESCVCDEELHLFEQVLESKQFQNLIKNKVSNYIEHTRNTNNMLFDCIRMKERKESEKEMCRSWLKSTSGKRPFLKVGEWVRIALREYDNVSAIEATNEDKRRIKATDYIPDCDEVWLSCANVARKVEEKAASVQRVTHVWFSEQVFVVTKVTRQPGNQYDTSMTASYIKAQPFEKQVEIIKIAANCRYHVTKCKYSDEADGVNAERLTQRSFRRDALLAIKRPNFTLDVTATGVDVTTTTVMLRDRGFRDLNHLNRSLMPNSYI